MHSFFGHIPNKLFIINKYKTFFEQFINYIEHNLLFEEYLIRAREI